MAVFDGERMVVPILRQPVPYHTLRIEMYPGRSAAFLREYGSDPAVGHAPAINSGIPSHKGRLKLLRRAVSFLTGSHGFWYKHWA